MATPQPPLASLGWRGHFGRDDPQVVALRAELDAEAGIEGLELVDSDAPGFAERCRALFHRDGFVFLLNALSPERVETVRQGCDAVARRILEHDPQRHGDRGSHRYCFGPAPAHFGALASWIPMVDPPKTLEALAAIFGSEDFRCENVGGDFILPGGVDYQDLHSVPPPLLPAPAPGAELSC